jgi:hypothetical protein
MTSTEVRFREACGGVRVRGGRCQKSRCRDTHALFPSSECPRIVWSARDICRASSMVYVCVPALAVGFRAKCAVVRVCR